MHGSTHIDTALRNYVERVAHKQEARDDINSDIREIVAEAKDAGFDGTMLRRMVREFRMDAEARNSMYQLQEDYRIKLGMLAGTPLGDAAEAREQADNVRPWPEKPFAEQPVHKPRGRGRPRKIDQHLDNARRHLGLDEPRANA